MSLYNEGDIDMASIHEDDELIKRVAVAMSENPRSTFKELAEVSGISKATLHRFCGTRENLEAILLERAETAVVAIIKTAEKDHKDYIIGLKDLIAAHFKEYEIFRWLFSQQYSSSEERCVPYFTAIESFFLRGQKQGAFRIDFSVSFLSNIFMSSICGLIDAERRGRVARVGITDAVEDFLLEGIQQK